MCSHINVPWLEVSAKHHPLEGLAPYCSPLPGAGNRMPGGNSCLTQSLQDFSLNTTAVLVFILGYMIRFWDYRKFKVLFSSFNCPIDLRPFVKRVYLFQCFCKVAKIHRLCLCMPISLHWSICQHHIICSSLLLRFYIYVCCWFLLCHFSPSVLFWIFMLLFK